jgi:hypothetical protein
MLLSWESDVPELLLESLNTIPGAPHELLGTDKQKVKIAYYVAMQNSSVPGDVRSSLLAVCGAIEDAIQSGHLRATGTMKHTNLQKCKTRRLAWGAELAVVHDKGPGLVASGSTPDVATRLLAGGKSGARRGAKRKKFKELPLKGVLQ